MEREHMREEIQVPSDSNLNFASFFFILEITVNPYDRNLETLVNL